MLASAVTARNENMLVHYASGPASFGRQTDAKHPGKPGNNPKGKVYFPLRIFPGFLGPEALYIFVTPMHQAKIVGLSQS